MIERMGHYTRIPRNCLSVFKLGGVYAVFTGQAVGYLLRHKSLSGGCHMYLVVSFEDAVHLCDFLTADCLDDEAFVVGQLEGRPTPSRRVPVNGGVFAQRHLVDNTNM